MSARTHVGGGGTLNLGAGSANTKINGILTMIAIGGVTLLGMQEGSDRTKVLAQLLEVLRHPIAAAKRANARRQYRRDLRDMLERARWRLFQPIVPGGKAVPQAYDASEWQLLRARTVLAVARQWVGAVGAGPTWAKPKVITRVVLRHRATLEVVEHLNTHMIPSATRHNLPAKELRARRAHYARQANAVARLVRRAVKRGHGVVVTMDANAGRKSALVEPFRDAELVGWTTEETMHGVGIDNVLTVRNGLVVGAPAKVIRLHGFDHHGVVRNLFVKADPR